MNFFKAADQSDSRVKFQQMGSVETQVDAGVQLATPGRRARQPDHI